MSVVVFLPAMAKAPGLFRKAIMAAREQSESARVICVMTGDTDVFDNSGGALDDVIAKVGQGMAEQEEQRAQIALEALSKLAGRCGLELSARTEIGDIQQVARDFMQTCNARHIIFIRPRSTALGEAVDRAQEALREEFECDTIVIG